MRACVHARMYAYAHRCHGVCMEVRGVRGLLGMGVFYSFHYVDPRNPTQVIKLGDKHLYLLSHLAYHPHFLIL